MCGRSLCTISVVVVQFSKHYWSNSVYPPDVRSHCLDLIASGYTFGEVSRRCGPSPSTIQKWHAKKLPPEKWTDERRRMVAKRRAAGASGAWLARRYRVSRTTVYRWTKMFL